MRRCCLKLHYPAVPCNIFRMNKFRELIDSMITIVNTVLNTENLLREISGALTINGN